MNPNTQWQWDPIRRDSYYFSSAENAWIYRSGQRVTQAQWSETSQTAQGVANNQSTFGSQSVAYHGQHQYAAAPYRPDQRYGGQTCSNSIVQYQQPQGYPGLGAANSSRPNFQTGYSNNAGAQYWGDQSAFSHQLPAQVPYGVHSQQPTAHGYSFDQSNRQVTAGSSSHGGDNPPSATGCLQTSPADEITDPALLKRGLAARGRISGSGGGPGRLDESFKVQPLGFFHLGKVFRILWPEPAGDSNSTQFTMDTNSNFGGERLSIKIRWFVVIKESNHYCSCLPIHTYGRRGTAKPSVETRHHAIVYDGDTEPKPTGEEKLKANGQKMLPSIRIIPLTRTQGLHRMSRINFDKIYTVEHNVKVEYVGVVDPEFIDQLEDNWKQLLSRSTRG